MRAGFFLGDDTCEGKLERDVSHSSLNVRVWNEGEECVRRIKRTVRLARRTRYYIYVSELSFLRDLSSSNNLFQPISRLYTRTFIHENERGRDVISIDIENSTSG